MLQVYVDADAKRMTIHRRDGCKGVVRDGKDKTIRLDTSTASSALAELRGGTCDGTNFWMDVDFADPVFEHAAVEHVRTILAPDNKAFSYGRTIGWHC